MSETATAVLVRQKMGRPKKNIATDTARLRRDIIEKARVVAVLRRIEVSEYLSNILAPVVDRDYKAERRKIASEDK